MSMKLSDYVHGSLPKDDRPLSQGTAKSIPTSRLRAAELARISVPPTRLSNGFTASSQNKPQVQRNNQHAEAPFPNRQDMFDTDVEGFDDSTTTLSLAKDEDVVAPEPVREERLASPRRGRDNGGMPQQNNASLDAMNGAFEQRNYRSIADRMRELDSEPDDEFHALPQDEYPEFDRYDDENIDNEGEPTIKAGWDTNNGNHQEAMSWQQIEAALRDHEPQINGSETISGPFSGHTSAQTGQNELHSPAANGQEYHEPVNAISTTPRATRKLVPGGRFTPKTRFISPKPPTPFSISRIPRPAFEPDYSQPSDAAPSRLNADYRPDQLPLSPSQTDKNNDPYHDNNQAGIFDTTDLSALESSEESIIEPNPPATATSPQLSTLSPVSSKRPFTAFTSDYHPNILQSKTYTDLQNESFDYNPAPPPPVFPSQDAELPLTEKLHRLKTLTDDQRRVFFSSLTLTDWEDSGDWLIEQFGVILQKTKDARRERRQVAAVFENEIKRRYESVETEVQEIRDRMDDMRAGGIGVLKGQV